MRRTLLLLMSLGLVFALCGIERSFAYWEPDRQIAYARECGARGRWEEARACFGAMLADRPNDAEARIELARANMRLGDVAQAKREYAQAVAEAPSREWIDEYRALLLRAGTDEELRALLRDSLAFDPVDDGIFLDLIARQNACADWPAATRTYIDMFEHRLSRGDIDGAVALLNGVDDESVSERVQTAWRLQLLFRKGANDVIVHMLDDAAMQRSLTAALDEETYIGAFDANGARTGIGVCFYPASAERRTRVYVGAWQDGMRAGAGLAFTPNGYYDGLWEDDLPNGAGMRRRDVLFDGAQASVRIDATYRDGLADGIVVWTFADGRRIEWRARDGVPELLGRPTSPLASGWWVVDGEETMPVAFMLERHEAGVD